jgi:hypothetical protein
MDTTFHLDLKRVKYETKREIELDQEYSDEMKNIFEIVKNKAFVNKKINEHTKYVKKIIENPYEEWEKLENRLKTHGPDASFPEFEGVVILLLRDLLVPNSKMSNEVPVDKNLSFLSVLKEQHIIKLTSLLFKSRSFLPYRQTIVTISDTLFFFDNVQRNSKSNPNPNPFFHTRRNYYYQNILLSLHKECVLFPSIYGIGSTDLIKVRCVPIFFIGVSSSQLFVDEYINTSVEFYFHDIQHARRMYYYNVHYYDTVYKYKKHSVSRSLYDHKSIKDMYKEASEFTKDVINPLLSIENQYHEKLSEEENALVKFNKMIIFEIIHEAAFFITPDTIVSKILEENNNTPVESIQKDETDQYPDVKNTMYEDPPVLSNMMYKLQSSFYDTEENRHDYIVPVKYRLNKYALISARNIISVLSPDKIDFEKKMEMLIKLKDKCPEPPKGYFIEE